MKANGSKSTNIYQANYFFQLLVTDPLPGCEAEGLGFLVNHCGNSALKTTYMTKIMKTINNVHLKFR